jgi:hypothetical protein
MGQEVIYPDGSVSTFSEEGGSFHDGGLAIERLRLLTAASALKVYLMSDGKRQVTRNGAQLAIANVIQPLTGKTYKRSMKGKEEAYADCLAMIAQIEGEAVVME